MSIKAQKNILSDILRLESLFDQAIAIGLTESHFDISFRPMWTAISKMRENRLEINLERLIAYDQDLINLALSVYNSEPLGKDFDHNCNSLIKNFSVKESAITLNEVLKKILASNGQENIDALIFEVNKIAISMRDRIAIDKRSTMFTSELLESTLDRLEKRIIDKTNGVTRGASTGLIKLDEQTGGLVGGRFYIIAARTSVGKTTFASFLALNAAKQDKNVLIFSNEMDAEDLVEKFISRLSFVNAKKIQTGELNQDEQNRIFEAFKNINNLKIGINQHYGWNLETLESEIYRCHAVNKCDIVFVDYTQQVSVNKSRNKVEAVSEVATRLKKISRDLNIAVVGLAQINRETEKSGQKPVIPGLANLKDSGALEQDADVVMILHKDDIAQRETILRLAKNRMGETGIIHLIHETTTNSYKQH